MAFEILAIHPFSAGGDTFRRKREKEAESAAIPVTRHTHSALVINHGIPDHRQAETRAAPSHCFPGVERLENMRQILIAYPLAIVTDRNKGIRTGLELREVRG